MTKLKTIKDKNIAFSGFIRNVIHLGMCDWIQKWQKDSLKEVPLELAKRASIIFNFHLSYEKHPMKDLKYWSEKVFSIIKELETLHDRKWNEYNKEIEIFTNTHNRLIDKYGDFILKIIPKITKIPWRYIEIWIIPSIYYGATTEDNKIFRGVIGKSLKKLKDVEGCIPGLVHELIHVNEQSAYLSRFNKEQLIKYVLDEYSKFKYPNATREITTIILTNAVIDELNKNFGLKIKKQKSHPHYKNLIKKIKKDLDRLLKTRGFKMCRKEVDKKLSQHN